MPYFIWNLVKPQ